MRSFTVALRVTCNTTNLFVGTPEKHGAADSNSGVYAAAAAFGGLSLKADDGPFSTIARAQSVLRFLVRPSSRLLSTVFVFLLPFSFVADYVFVQNAYCPPRPALTQRALYLRSGVYAQPATLNLTAGDSGTVWKNYPGERAVISGGMRVAGPWSPHPTLRGVFRTTLPKTSTEQINPAMYPTQLWVNDTRMVRAREPDLIAPFSPHVLSTFPIAASVRLRPLPSVLWPVSSLTPVSFGVSSSVQRQCQSSIRSDAPASTTDPAT
jgi:hypothetical protein